MTRGTLLLSLLLMLALSCKMEEKEYKIEDNIVTNTDKEVKKEEDLPPVSKLSKENKHSNEEIQKAEYPGGMSAFNNQFISKFRVPNIGSHSIQIIIQFTIEADGSITDIEVVKDPGYGAGKEAIRVLNNMSRWIPAELNDKRVRSQFTLPIVIQVQ
ncbi:energy transducer TonB [Myroides sp. M-43]|uniref:energy transducer TonB n=1 Tax=Myroides oncorhynchi TaxID=2893756 RepID=UPI001E4B80FB|nr:energy transducer TonB [Myroides oncorhynchi]MCC9042533.1 energy transducer TonB [Myroides oncorhynchi]